jgi:amidohydrolase
MTLEEYVISLRREFHEHPELSMKEYTTADRIEKELNSFGIPVRRIGKTGVSALLDGKKKSSAAVKTVVLRADIDALPIQEQTNLPFASKTDGVMHACGHDAHAASLLGAAKLLAAHRDEINGRVQFLFQPGEEFGEGAKPFIDAGLLDGADRVFGIHLASNVPVGKVAVSAGSVNASVDYFKITVTGKPVHVSVPQSGVDALYISALLVTQLQGIVSRLSDPLKAVLIGIGVLKAGDAYNIVAGKAVMEGTLRCLDKDVREKTVNKIREIATTTGTLYGADVSVDFKDFTPVLTNNEQVVEEIKTVGISLFGAPNIIPREPSLGGDNFAEYIQKIPGAYAYVGSRNGTDPKTQEEHHSDHFEIDERCLLVAARLYANYALYSTGNTLTL